ncbi:coiled-coil domain-containing protein [Coprococcus comes]|uniref:hypothetical protein n=1 Tax=Coprococcus comes TaxID=410072 RepID=UPI00319DE62F
MANNIIQAVLDYRYVDTRSVWQYDYGQILRIQGENLPKAVEVHFSLNEVGGDSITKIGVTTDGITEVQVPDELLENGGARFKYSIYAFVYTEDGASGNTEYRVRIPVQVRPKPSDHVTPDNTDIDPFGDVVKAVNNAAERAEASEQKAKEHAASASGSAVTAEKTKEDALRKVGEKKREAIEAIQNQEETSVGKITTHTDGEIQRIQNQATDSKAGLEQTITNAGVSKEELDESIQTASDTKTALDKSVELAGTAKTELDTSTLEAGTAKTALDESTETAGTVQETLSATAKQAGALDTSLGEKIKTGTQLKTDLTASGEKAVQDIQTAGSEQLGKMQAVAEAFTADREQIANNKEDIGSLKEDISNKITKFYASNQGETHITDSDKGLIQNLKIYGQSKQDGEPSPSNPVEIKNVVNPKMSVCGSNILQKNAKNISLSTFKGNITLNDDGSLSYEGSILSKYAAIYIGRFSLKKGTYQLLANQYSSPNDMGAKLIIEKASGTEYILNNKPFVIDADDTKCRIFISSEVGVNYPLAVSGTVKCALVYSGSTTDIQPYIGKSVTLPITLNAIPVSSGGNVTINGQQYIADYVDMERGKVVRMCGREALNTKNGKVNEEYRLAIRLDAPAYDDGGRECIFSTFEWSPWETCAVGTMAYIKNVKKPNNELYTAQELKELSLDFDAIYQLAEPQKTDLTTEEITAFKALATYYPVTNISINSEQLDGYTVFNYPISMKNGWDYVKKQLNDNRDYIYDMDAKTQDIDTQSAEAYVNSEYAVALTELEVM